MTITYKQPSTSTRRHDFLSSPEELIEEARNGRMFILVDDEDRENEGDLVVPAQMATPDAINFMARYGRGLICLALAAPRVNQLGLDLMSRENGTRHATAFTISIEARSGVTTGISAADRARTIAVAIDASRGRDELVSPGHVFPLIARDGGVLVRAGHTEAAVDIARLAGLNPSGVICEIMKDDGNMARLDDLIVFAELHKLKLGTIRDLIAYRRRHDHMVEMRAEAMFESDWGGIWKAITFWNSATGTEQLALVKGAVEPGQPTLVRMHSVSPFSDLLGEGGPSKQTLRRSMEAIGAEGAGVIVIINRPSADIFSRALKRRAGAPVGPEAEDLRDYGVGASILLELGVREMVLLSNAHHNLVGLEGHGLTVIEERPFDP